MVSERKKRAASKIEPRKKSRKNVEIKVKVKGKPAEKTVGQRMFAIILIMLPLVIGIMSATVAGSAMASFDALSKPPLMPSALTFIIIWTVLYILMGVALLSVFRFEPKDESERNLQNAEIVVFFVQLFFNYMWTILFFKFEIRWFALGWLIVMWLMILALACMCMKNRKAAAWCLVPYALWCTFAIYLNIMIAVLN